MLERVHVDIFPIRYDRDFFLSVVNGNDIISWGAVDTSRSDGHRDELIGFVTTKMVAAKDSGIENPFMYNSSWKDLTLTYILTLGVVDRYRDLGVASSLVQDVIKYSTGIINCRDVYLHVLSYNQPAISFYEKTLFNLVRRLPMLYYIKGQHYNSYLFAYYHWGSFTLLTTGDCSFICCVLQGLPGGAAYKSMEQQRPKYIPKWSRFKESNNLLVTQNDMRIINGEDMRRHV